MIITVRAWSNGQQNKDPKFFITIQIFFMAYTTPVDNGNVKMVIFDGEGATPTAAANNLGLNVNTYLGAATPAPDKGTMKLSQLTCVYDITTAFFVMTCVGYYTTQ